MANYPIRRFTYVDPAKNADKFWNVKLNENQIQLWWGRNGTAGQSKVLDFSSKWQAENVYLDRIQKKSGEGYTESKDVDEAGREIDDLLNHAAGPEDEGGPDGDFLRRLRKKVAAQYGKG